MLHITVRSGEFWDEKNKLFITTNEQELVLEHSLVSISKWESKWLKVFLSKEAKTYEQSVDYVKCMTLTQNVNDHVYLALSAENLKTVNDYIEAPMSATYFSNTDNTKRSREPVTSELIYYRMVVLNIPFECQKWHLNRLLTLINICNLKNSPPKKMTKRQIMARNIALNEQRQQQLNSKG